MIYFLDNSLQLQKIVTSKNVISAIHEHELNGLIRADVELDLSYANKFLILGIDHVGYYYKDEFYLHKIQRVEYDHVNESATVVLRHIFFEDMIFGKLIRDVRPQNQDALTVSRQTIDANTRWQTIMTDVTGRLSTNFYWQVPYEVIEFMTENYRIEYLPKILFDGKKINGFQLHLANKIGEDKNIRIPYGSRVLDLKYEEDYSEIITKLVVHGKGEEVGDGYGRRINISDINFSRNGVKSPVGSLYLEDESITNTYGNDGQTPREGREVFEDIEDANELAEAGYQHYLQVSRPQMLFTADVADIGDVGIGDSVMIIRREYDVYFKARIHKLSVDLLYPEDAQVELGDYKHFKESKITRKSREKNNRVQKQLSDRITRLKLEANERFDNEVAQWKSEYEQALIDVHAEIEADRENMTNLIETERTEMTDEFNQSVSEAKEYAEQQAIEKAESVQSNLDSFSNRHEQLVSDLQNNVINIDQFLGDKSVTLNAQFDKVRTDFEGLQTDLDGVGTDLESTRSSLQTQLDDARAELDGLEYENRNIALNSNFEDGLNHFNYTNVNPENNLTSEGLILDAVNKNSPYIQPSAVLSPGTYAIQIWYENLEGHVPYLWSSGSEGIVDTIYPFETGEGEKVARVIFTTDVDSLMHRIRYAGSAPADHTTGKTLIKRIKIERGTKFNAYSKAPEDTDNKITTLNQSITNINGQLSAKLEQTDIEPINNKITEYGNTLTANAQSIESLIEKTELHDDDITQWSNQTTATAEELTRSLTRISNVEGDLSTVENTLTETADELSRTMTRVTNAEGDLEQAQLDITATADGLSALVTKTDEHEIQLTSIVADINGIEQTVARHNGDMLTEFTNIDQRFDSITNTVANIKLNTRNMLRGTSFDNPELITLYGDARFTTIHDPIAIRVGPSPNTNTSSFKLSGTVKLEADTDYYLVIEVRNSIVPELDYLQLELEDGSYQTIYDADTGLEGFSDLGVGSSDWSLKTIRINSETELEGQLRIGTRFNRGDTSRGWVDIRQPYLTNTLNREWVPHPRDGQSVDELVERVSEIEQTAEEIRSTVYDSTGLATIIAQSSSAVDIIAKNINVTGNLNLRGQIEAISLSAVTADVAEIFSKNATLDIIQNRHLSSNSVRAENIFVDNLLVDKLVSHSGFFNELTALSLDAVHADLTSVNSKIMETSILKAEWIRGGNALLDKVFGSTAMFERMMAKSGFVTSLSAVTLDLHELTIWRPDGVAFVQNGMERFGHPVPLTQYIDYDVTWDGRTYETQYRTAKTILIAPGEHAGRYYNLTVIAGGRFSNNWPSTEMEVIINVVNRPSGVSWGSSHRETFTVSRGSADTRVISFPLGRPTYGGFLFTIQFRKTGNSHDDDVVNLRTGRSWVSA